MLFVLYLVPYTKKFVLHAHVYKFQYLSSAIIGLDVVFNLDLFIILNIQLFLVYILTVVVHSFDVFYHFILPFD